MSRYIIHTTNKQLAKIKIIVIKLTDYTSIEIEDEFGRKTISENFENFNDYNIPEEYMNVIQSNKLNEVLLFKDNEILSTDWRYVALNDFDTNLYEKNTYKIIKDIKDLKFKYEYLFCFTENNYSFDIVIDNKSTLIKSIDKNNISYEKLKEIKIFKALLETLEKTTNLYNYTTVINSTNKSLIINIKSK